MLKNSASIVFILFLVVSCKINKHNLHSLPVFENEGKKYDVIIVGAGMAGVAAAS